MKNCTRQRSRWHAPIPLLLLFFSLLSFTGSAQLVAKSLKAANGESIGFYEYKPYDYNPSLNPKYPVIIFLHGIGERGNGTTDLPSVLGNGTPAVIKAGHSMRFFWNGKWETFLVLIPQLSKNYGWWQNFYVDEMIKYAKENLNVDPNRITLTGLSLGGGGVWGWAGASTANASTLNCIGLCCATCPNINFSNLTNTNTPVWAFHAKDDPTVGEGCTGASIQAIEKLNPAVKPYYTMYATGGHSIWGAVFDPGYDKQNPNIYEWFLGQNKSLPVNKRPVANAGAAQTVTINSTVTLNASGSTDADGKLVRYIWTKKSGPGFGTITTPVSTDGKTTVTGLISAGTYVYEVKVVDDRCDWTFATVTITVVPGAGPNQAPTAKAGNDYGINQPTSSITLNGSASVDPEGQMASYTWTQVSGPTTATIANAAAATTTASNLTALGTYTFRLVVKDKEGLSGTDEISVTVNGPNKLAIPNAGPDIVITLPNNTVTLDGTASVDPDGPISMYGWAKMTGPPDFTIVSPNGSKTQVTGLVQGVYTFKLTVLDNLWVPATDEVQVTVLAASGNLAPTANAGADITITLPTNSTTLNGLGSTDPNGNNTITTYKWSWVSGPTQYTIANANTGSTALTNLAAGTYVFKLQVTDNGGLSSEDQVTVVVKGPANQAPVASAGAAQTLTLPNNSLTLDGSGSADGDGSITGYSWAWVSGPTQYNLANATAATTQLSNLAAGTYVFKLTVTDNGGLTGSSTITITVKAAPVNQAPVAKVGTDITLTLPTNSATLDGTASTDPDGTISGYAWSWVSGPTQYNLSNAGAATTQVSNLVAGTYSFNLTVTDNEGKTASATIKVVVNNAAPVNKAPIANAGADIAITLPTNSTALNGSASSDPDGTITGWSWKKLTGPTNFTLSATNIASPALTGLELGTYTFELTVTDNEGATAKDEVTIIVKPEPPATNKPAVAAAGADIIITLPTNSVTLDGSGSSDPDGPLSGYSWTRVSGPTQFTLANPGAAITQLTNLVAGTYKFNLRVWDNVWVPADDQIVIVVNPEPNVAPVANAGADIVITLPTNSTVLNGSASTDPNGNNTIASYKWTRTSGTGQFTLANANAATTALTDLVEGIYTFQLEVTDNGGLKHTDEVEVLVKPIPNRAPLANAGSDINITLPVNSTTLNGSGSTDPDGNNTIAYRWAKTGGPAQSTLSNPTAASTPLTNLVAGTYTFELTVTDNFGLTSKDVVTVTVNPRPNQAPVANAGTNVNIPLPNNSTTLNGSGSTDPDGNNTITGWSWTLLSGPAQYTLANPNAATTALTNLAAGTYTFQLKVTDNGGLSSTDVVVITVSPIPNRAPVANAGSDIVIALPTNSVTLDGTASTDEDGDNTIASYYWTRVSGPAQYTLTDPYAATTSLTNLAAGTYTFKLEVTDNGGLTAEDLVVITVSPIVNSAPVANAGTEVVLTLPVNSTTLNGSASNDPDGNNTLTYAWTKVSGPGQFTIVNATAATTALNDLVEGEYVFALTVKDNYNLTDKATVKITVKAGTNQAPVANAGADIAVTLPFTTIQLDGSKSNDPDGTIVSYAWLKIAGTGDLTIVNATSSKPVIIEAEAGEYEFELTVTDNKGATAKDRVKVTISTTPITNKAPVANAGADINVTLPITTIQLDGSGSSDPDGTIAAYAWVKVAGTGNLTIVNATSSKPIITEAEAGVYEFELTVTDNKGATATDRVKITINAAPVANKAPIAHAGDDIEVTLPITTIQLDGSKSTDPDGTIATYAWVKVAGSGNLTIVNATSSKPIITEAEAGVYEFELTVTDNKGATAKDRVSITINAAPVPVNKKPVAVAGKDTTLAVPNTAITLNGQASYDEDGTIAKYSWKQLSGPTKVRLEDNAMIAKLGKLETGVYVFQLTVTDDKGAESTAERKVTVVNNMRYDDNISVYPNPTSGVNTINIRCITDALGWATLTVMDQFGRPIAIYRRNKTQAYQEFQLPVTNLKNGNYYVEVQIERKKRMVVKFIKQ
ncbi:PKD domain-containing protein [Paraflavitalea pollutisoli]|uniref:PKD domain-containing protein n=1 Tax=Paraflavitalea pollutisoli TaxID=3034143 RepID=UPI0023ECFA79|nr:PKD domain-containing protein [Paraflavitalea sp. H1-2-19X]